MNKSYRNPSILQFAGMASQWIIVLIGMVYFGNWADKKYDFTKGLFIWLLPLLSLIGLMFKLIRDTSKK